MAQEVLKNSTSPTDKAQGEGVDFEKASKDATNIRLFRQLTGDEAAADLRAKIEQQREDERIAAATRAQFLEEEKEKRLKDEHDKAAEEAKSEREKRETAEKALQDNQLNNMRKEFADKMGELQKTIDKGMNPKTFLEQFSELQEAARQIGFQPGGGTVAREATADLEIKKLEWQMKKDEREFQRQMKKDEREWQLQLRRLDDERDARRDEARRQEKKEQWLANAPQMLGSALAKGVLQGTLGSPEVSGNMQPPDAKVYHIELNEGEADEIPCPDCGTAIGVGEHSQSAVCVGCGKRYDVKRMPAEATID